MRASRRFSRHTAVVCRTSAAPVLRARALVRVKPTAAEKPPTPRAPLVRPRHRRPRNAVTLTHRQPYRTLNIPNRLAVARPPDTLVVVGSHVPRDRPAAAARHGRSFGARRAVRLAVHIRVLQILPGTSLRRRRRPRRRTGRVPSRQRHPDRAQARGVRRVRRVRERPAAVRLNDGIRRRRRHTRHTHHTLT